MSVNNADQSTARQHLKRYYITTIHPQQLHCDYQDFKLVLAAGNTDKGLGSLNLEADPALSQLPKLNTLLVFQAILRENVRKFFVWRSRSPSRPSSDYASISTDEAQAKSQTDSFTGYVASQEDIGTSGEEDMQAGNRSRRSSGKSSRPARLRYCHYSPFPAPGFDPLLIGVRPLFSVGLASVGTWSTRDSLWKKIGKLACVCSGLYAFGCLLAWTVVS